MKTSRFTFADDDSLVKLFARVSLVEAAKVSSTDSRKIRKPRRRGEDNKFIYLTIVLHALHECYSLFIHLAAVLVQSTT